MGPALPLSGQGQAGAVPSLWEALSPHQGLTLSLQVTCEQMRRTRGQETGKSPQASVRGMALFQEVPTVCGDTSCQGAPAFPGVVSSADGFLKFRAEETWGRMVSVPLGKQTCH